jgi:hypothetical protein
MANGDYPSAPPGFVEQFAEAERAQARAWVSELTDISDESASDPQDVSRNRLRVGTRQWLASKILRDVYGDRVEVAGDPNAPLVVAAARTRVTERLTALAESLKRGPDCDMVESPQLVHLEATCDVPSAPVGLPARAGR